MRCKATLVLRFQGDYHFQPRHQHCLAKLSNCVPKSSSNPGNLCKTRVFYESFRWKLFVNTETFGFKKIFQRFSSLKRFFVRATSRRRGVSRSGQDPRWRKRLRRSGLDLRSKAPLLLLVTPTKNLFRDESCWNLFLKPKVFRLTKSFQRKIRKNPIIFCS